MRRIEDNVESDALLPGSRFVWESGWVPPAIVLSETASALSASTLGSDNRTAYVERLALAFAALTHKGRANAATELAELELLGNEVGPGFAEQGAAAHGVIRTAIDLADGRAVDPLRIAWTYSALAHLWGAAFNAPDGYAHYIERSLSGLLPQETNFFITPPRPTALPADQEARYLARMIDLLQAGIATRNLPAYSVGVEPTLPDWKNPVGRAAIASGVEGDVSLTVHVMHEELAHGQRIEVLFREDRHGDPVAGIQAVILRGRTGVNDGNVDDFCSLASCAGPCAETVVGDVFGHPDGLGLAPRVRELLDVCGNRLFAVGVVEGMYVKNRWRTPLMGERLIRQLMVEAGPLQALLARPAPIQPSFAETVVTRGILAGFAVGKVRLANRFAQYGARVLVDGVMGIDEMTLMRLQDAGQLDRQAE